MAYSHIDLEVAERHVDELRGRVEAGRARLLDLARRGEPTEAAEAEYHAVVEALGRLIDHVAVVRVSAARRRQDRPAPEPRLAAFSGRFLGRG